MAIIEHWKTRFRTWLLAIVREAIQIETRKLFVPEPSIAERPKPASKPVTVKASEPSFERSEAEALQAQEKYYEPKLR